MNLLRIVQLEQKCNFQKALFLLLKIHQYTITLNCVRFVKFTRFIKMMYAKELMNIAA